MRWNPFDKMRTVICSGNRKILVFKNPRNAYPLYSEDFSAKFKVAADAAAQLQGEIGGEFARRMSGLLILLDETNGSMQIELSAIYQYYSEDPCNREQWFQRRLELILDEVNLFRRAKFELDALRLIAEKNADQAILIDRVDQMMKQLRLSDDEHSRRTAFDNASKAVDAWKK